MNTVEQFITNTIDTYVEPLMEGFKNRGRGKPKSPEQVAQEVQNDASKITNARTASSSNTLWVAVAFVVLVLILIGTNVMGWWTVNGAKEFTMSIPSRITGTFSSKPADATGGTISEVADISVTQA